MTARAKRARIVFLPTIEMRGTAHRFDACSAVSFRQMAIEAVRWQDGRVMILDQRQLPHREVWLEASTWQQVAEAIRNMAVRGAPLIGVAAAYGLALAGDVEEAKAGLAATRPTAVNLFWALERVSRAADRLAEARAIEAEERKNNDAIGKLGAELVPEDAGVLTICNTGSLATPGIGTALGVIRTAWACGSLREVYACETRPRQQGLRLTAWELAKDGIPFHCIADAAAAWLMKSGRVSLVVVGADRVAANGDTANKVGTYSLATIARAHGIPFMVAAPSSTLDLAMPDGRSIPIEERDASELTDIEGSAVAPAGTPVWNPAFDVTPAELITWVVTEQGVFSPPFRFS
jgi:methylthioribose-1-phosphate isomerase